LAARWFEVSVSLVTFLSKERQAEEVGMSESSFYQHFGSDEL